MNLLTEPVTRHSRQQEDRRTPKEWLDSLSSGACDQEAFLLGVSDFVEKSPDVGWELLALVDQYYRRGKITAKVFGDSKSHLQSLLMGNGRGAEFSVPLPRMQDEPPATSASPPPFAPAPVPGPARAKPAAESPVPAYVTLPTPGPPAWTPLATSAPSVEAPRAAPVPNSAPPPGKAAPKSTSAPSPAAALKTAAPGAASAPSAASVRKKASSPGAALLPNAAWAPGAASGSGAASAPSAAWTPDAAWAARAVSVAGAAGSPDAASMPGADSVPATRSGEQDTDTRFRERSLAVGDVLRGRYRVQGMLGQGGMGSVFEAIDLYRLDRPNGDQKVAIKVLHTAVMQRPRLFAELRREFQHLQSLSHPNIVRVHEFDRDGDLAFFTMEYLSGALLSRLLSIHQFSTLARPYALAIIRDIGSAVAHAHLRGVVHGDLNPGNIFITDEGEIRVLDFGASHQLRRGPWISEFENSQRLTVATPTYASCQLLEGEAADARDDVYALACIAYVLLTGKHPFAGQSALKARTSRLTPDRPRGLDRRQWQALRAGLHFDRESRPGDLQAWLNRLDLQAAADKLPALPTLMIARPARRRGLGWATVSALALIAAAGGWAMTHVDSIAQAGAAVSAKVSPLFANSALSQLWDNHQDIDTAHTAAAPASAAPAPESPNARPALPGKPASAPNASRTPAAGAAAPAVTANAPGTALGQSGSPVRARIELTADNVEVTPTEPIARVMVHRSRTMRGDVSFSWWTESGTAKPGQDFVPVKSQVEHIEDGKGAVDLVIPIVVDPTRRTSRSFYVVIDEASDNAVVGPRTLTMVTIPGSE